MKNRWKTALSVCGLLATGSLITGMIDIKERKQAEQKAEAEGREIHRPYGVYEKYFKRPLDFGMSGLALIVLSPVMAVTAFLVRTRLGDPVFFIQERPGKDGKIFKLVKFRSMTDKKDASGELLPDTERITPFGEKMRSLSLDELPELFNILKGDMSIVGPRPLLVRYLPRYNKRQATRHDVRPGLTGLAQVSGRNLISWKDKLEDDAEYVEKITFAGDVRIVLKTALVVLKHNDISLETEEFMGEQK